MKRGSALIMALWTIAVLSIMVLSFATEAHIETGINVYVRERNRVNRLVDAGQALGEIVLVGYHDVDDWSADQDVNAKLEEDRWFLEKQQLKMNGTCTIGPILLDADDPDSGTVTVKLAPVNGGSDGRGGAGGGGVINVNLLSKAGGDAKYQERWWMIFRACDIPEDFSTEKDGTIHLWNQLIASWDDWVDEDDLVSAIDGEDCGAEAKWYEEYDEDNKIEDEDRKAPRNAEIADVHELGYVRGFRDYPQILFGGVINPWERKDDQITVKGVSGYLCTEGSAKVNVNGVDAKTLVTVPGIFRNPEEEDSIVDAEELAAAIVAAKSIEPDWEHDEKLTEWPLRDWDDLLDRLEDSETDLRPSDEAKEYLDFQPDEKTLFWMTITGESMGMYHSAMALCYVKDKKVRYIEWNEETGTGGK